MAVCYLSHRYHLDHILAVMEHGNYSRASFLCYVLRRPNFFIAMSRRFKVMGQRRSSMSLITSSMSQSKAPMSQTLSYGSNYKIYKPKQTSYGSKMISNDTLCIIEAI
jgi:hypothetical protein